MAARAPGETESRRFLRARLLPPRLRSRARCARGQTIPRTARPRRSGGSRGSCRRRARVGGPSGRGTTAAEPSRVRIEATQMRAGLLQFFLVADRAIAVDEAERSEEHTSELQSPCNLVCRLLLEKKKKNMISAIYNRKNRELHSHPVLVPYSCCV